MHVAQSGIFALGTGSHSYLEFDVLEHADPLTLVQVMANLGEPRMTTGGVNLVVGFKPSLCPPLSMTCGSGWQAMPTIRSSMSHAKRLPPWPRLQSLPLKSLGGPTRRVGT